MFLVAWSTIHSAWPIKRSLKNQCCSATRGEDSIDDVTDKGNKKQLVQNRKQERTSLSHLCYCTLAALRTMCWEICQQAHQWRENKVFYSWGSNFSFYSTDLHLKVVEFSHSKRINSRYQVDTVNSKAPFEFTVLGTDFFSILGNVLTMNKWSFSVVELISKWKDLVPSQMMRCVEQLILPTHSHRYSKSWNIWWWLSIGNAYYSA